MEDNMRELERAWAREDRLETRIRELEVSLDSVQYSLEHPNPDTIESCIKTIKYALHRT